jgi:amino acid permease
MDEYKSHEYVPGQDTAAEKNGYQSPEKFDAEHGEIRAVQLKRRLQSRHLQMIAIGGTIGTGLFIGSGGALATSGPAGTLIAYAFVGTIVYSVMVALGEMATFIPVSGKTIVEMCLNYGLQGMTGAFTTFAARFVDPSLGFAMVSSFYSTSVYPGLIVDRDGFTGSPGQSRLPSSLLHPVLLFNTGLQTSTSASSSAYSGSSSQS